MNYLRINGLWYYSKPGMEAIQALYRADLIYHVEPDTSEITVTKCRKHHHDSAPAPTHKELMQIRLQAVPLPRYMRGQRKSWCKS